MRASHYRYFGGLIALISRIQNVNAFTAMKQSKHIGRTMASSSPPLNMGRRGLETLEEGATPLRE
jgi:hypothetical protein